MHFDEVYTLEIAFLQSFCIMEVCGGGAYLWLYPEHPDSGFPIYAREPHHTKGTCGEDRRFRFQLSRIVSGETRTVSSDILIGVAKEFKVSTDYILGLSTVSVRKSYDISELGLSEEP